MPERVDYRAPIKIEAVGIGNSGRPMSYFEYVPVEPLTRVQIAAMPRTERVALLQDQQLAYARPYLEEAFKQPLSEVKPDTLRLAVTIFDVQQRNWELIYDANKRDAASKTYAEEKRKIRASGKSKGDQARAVESALKVWQQQDLSLKQEVEADKALKKDIIDLFIKDTLLTKDGPQNFLVAAEDLMSQTSISQDSIIRFLQEATARLKDVKVAEDLSHLRYKNGTDNFITEEDSQLLQNVVRLAFGEAMTDPVKNQLGQVASSLINSYWRNNSSFYGTEEKTPKIAFLHDVSFAALITGDITVIKNTIKHIWSYIDLSLSDITNEVTAIEKSCLDEAVALATLLENALGPNTTKKSVVQFINEADPRIFNEFNPQYRRCFIGKNYDRRPSLHAVARFAHDVLGLKNYTERLFPLNIRIQFPNTQKAQEVMRLMEYIDPLNKKIRNTFYQSTGLDDLAMNYAKRDDYEKWVAGHISVSSVDDRLTNTKERQDIFSYNMARPDRRAQWSSSTPYAKLGIRMLFAQEGLEDLDNFEKVSSRNNRLFRGIRYSNLWFIAENSDRYSVANNPDLAQHSISSVVFSPEPQIEGWKIGIATDLRTLEGEPVSYTFHLNRDGKFLTESGVSLNNALVPLWLRLPFERFILERLYFITSGVLGDRGAHKTQEVEGNQAEKRRHHWRKLISTKDRMYTLMSYSARRHATFVRERYGHDIYRENILRRAEGELTENECVTFVKAIVPSENAEPNEIIFNPNLLSTVN